MTGFEQDLLHLSAYLSGLSQKCIVAAIKKGKETWDQHKAEKGKHTLDEHEFAKSVSTKIQQQITASIRSLRLTPEQLQEILSLETNPFLKDSLTEKFLTSDISPEFIEELFISQNPALEALRGQLHLLAVDWLDALDKVVAGDPILPHIVNFRGFRSLRQDLKSMGTELVKSNVRAELAEQKADQRHSEVLAAISKFQPGYDLRGTNEVEDTTPDHLKSLNQRRFDRARERLLNGSLVLAEQGFRELIDDLEALKDVNDSELKLKCSLNIAACLWEQNKIDDAVVWFEKSFALNPNDWRAMRGKAFALVHQNSVEKALEIFRRIRLERPNESEHVCNEVWLLKNTGRVQEAIQLLESRVFEDEIYYAILSFAYSRADRSGDAETAARKAFQLKPKSELVLMALSFAIGFPVIQRRARRETLQFVPSDDERKKLLEAIDYAEQAAIILRTNVRIVSLIDVLSNLTAFYPAVGNCERAIIIAGEALQYVPNDINILRNLWCSQMRLGQFGEAIQTAGKLEILDDPVDWWKRKSEAQILTDKSQAVLDSWDSIKSDRRFSENMDCVAILASAYSKRHRTEEGIRILDEALIRSPSNPCLLTQRGLLLEVVGKISEARADFENAEKSPSSEFRAQCLLDFGRFLYFRHEWKTAAERFKTLGAESVHHPLFSSYLICLFNQGVFRESLELAEQAIKQEPGFVEDIYAIAARCHYICNNLPRAKELLDILVGKVTARELEHRKLLASVYSRMDDLPQAHDLLLRCLKLKSDDQDALYLISGVCTILGKHKEAVEYAHQATVLAPDSLRAHTAMVSAAFACPPNTQLPQEQLDAHYRSLAFLQQSNSGILRAVPVEPDFHSILEMVKANSEEVRKFEDFFVSHPLPMGVFANRIGRSLFQTWVALMHHDRLKIRIAFGTTEEQQGEISVMMKHDSVSIDLFAILSLQHLSLLQLLPKMFKRVCVHSSLLDQVVADLREIQQHPDGCSISYLDGKFYRHERNPEQNKIAISFLTEIRDFLKSPSVELTGLLPETTKAGNAGLFVEACGITSVAPVFVAQEKALALFADDACLRSMGKLECQVPGFCIQAFLRVAVQKGIITPTEYQDALIKLIKCNYAFVSEDASVLRRCYQTDNGRIGGMASTLVNRVNNHQCNTKSCLPILAEFSVFLWRNKEPDGANKREEWLLEIWQALSLAADADELILEFIANLAVACPAQPAVFFGILNNALLEIPFVSRRRIPVFRISQETAKAMSRLTMEQYPFWPDLAADWLRHQKLNDRLAKLGFFDRHVADKHLPAQGVVNHNYEKSRKARLKSKRRLKGMRLQSGS